MRGMYMKVLVVPSERLAIMAELTAGIDNILSTSWGDMDRVNILNRVLAVWNVIASDFGYRVDESTVYVRNDQIQTLLEKKVSLLETAQHDGVKLLSEIPSGGVHYVLSWFSNVEDNAKTIESDIAMLEKHIWIINKLIQARDDAASSLAELSDCMRDSLRFHTPLPSTFEIRLGAVERVCIQLQSLTAKVNSAEVFTTYDV